MLESASRDPIVKNAQRLSREGFKVSPLGFL